MTRSVCLIGLFLLSGMAAAAADPRQDTLAGISRCAALPDDRTFLDCVYGAAQPMRAELGLAPAPDFQLRLVPPASGRTASRPPTASAPVSERPGGKTTGLFGSMLGGDQALRMASYSFNPRGLFTVTLSDGEIWRQRANDTSFADWRGPASDYYVNVSSNPGGGFNLSVRGDPGLYQVERVK